MPSSSTPTWGQIGDALLQGVTNPFGTLSGKDTAAMDTQIASGQGPLTSTINALSSWSIARVVTILLGAVLIVAGIFALTRGPAVQIVSSAARETLTS